MDFETRGASLFITRADDEKRELTGIANTADLDSYRTIIEPDGAEYRLPLPLLYSHDDQKPVGEVYEAKRTRRGLEFKARIFKSDRPGAVADRLDEAWDSVRLGLMKSVSIGFTPLGRELLDGGIIRYIKWRWRELSLVTMGANDKAKITSYRSDRIKARAHAGRDASAGRTTAARAASPTTTPRRSSMDIKARLAKLQATKKTKEDEFDDILAAAEKEGRTRSEDERQTCEELRADIQDLETEISDLEWRVEQEQRNQQTSAKEAKEVGKVETRKDGSESRKGNPRVVITDRRGDEGIAFAQAVKCLAQARGIGHVAAQIAQEHYSYDERIESFCRAAVGAGQTTTGADFGGVLAEPQLVDDFLAFLRPRTIIGQFGTENRPALRPVPFNTKVPRQTTGSTGYWVGEGKAAPASAGVFDTVVMGKTKVAALIAVTREMLRFGVPGSDQLLRNDLAAGVISAMDLAFVDASSEGTADKPASIVADATAITSAGADAAAVRTDLQKLMDPISDANIPDSDIVLIMADRLKRALQLMTNDLGAKEFPDIPDGTVEGIPYITSNSVPIGTVIAVAASQVMLADDGEVSIDASNEASIMMDNAPNANMLSGTSATGMVSMFQNYGTALLAMRMVNWKLGREAGAQLLTGAGWNGAKTA